MSGKSAAGFTLLEVVVALAIAALALIVLLRAGGEGLFAADTASRAEEAVERAQSHLAAIGRQASLLPGDFQGDDGGGYRWHLRVTPVARRRVQRDSGSPVFATTLFDVEVTITWSGRRHDRAVVLRTERIATAAGNP